MVAPRETLRQLQHLITLSERVNYHAAAEELGITQAALTQSIQKLEDHYGVQLFTRGTGGVQITKFGLIVADAARDMLEKLASVRYEIRVAQKLEMPRIVVGCDPFLSEAIIAPALADPTLCGGAFTYTLETGSWEVMKDSLLSRRLHFYLGFVDDEPNSKIALEHYSLPPWLIYFRKAHPLAGRGTVEFDEVYQYPMVLPKLSRAMLLCIQKYYVKSYPDALPQVPAYVLTSDHSIARHIVSKTDAVGAAFDWSIAPEIESGLFSSAAHPDFPHVPCVLATFANAQPILSLDALLAVLRQRLRELSANRDLTEETNASRRHRA